MIQNRLKLVLITSSLIVMILSNLTRQRNTEKFNHIVDDLSHGEDHEDHEGNPEEKDIVKYCYIYLSLQLFQTNILY